MIEDHSYDSTEAGSPRTFGVVFSMIFACIYAYTFVVLNSPAGWALVMAFLLAMVSLVVPAALALPNRLWHRFGILLGRVTSPVFMALIYALAIVPTGVIMRLAGKNLLSLRSQPERATYWISRDRTGGDEPSMRNQF